MRRGVFRKVRRAEFAGRNVAEGDGAGVPLEIHGREIVRPPLLEHGALGHGAGRDDADDVALDQPLRQRRVLHLLADGDLVALGDEPADVRLRRVIRHAAHRRALVGIFHVAVARREREIQLPRRRPRVVVEHLIEIPQPEKQQAVRLLLLDLIILPLHGGHFSHDGCLLICICMIVVIELGIRNEE